MDADTKISEVWNKMLTQGFAQYPIKETDGSICGIVTKTELMNKLVKKRVSGSDPVRNIVSKELRHVSLNMTLNELSRVLTRNRFVLVDKQFICTSTDLLSLVTDELDSPSKIQLKNEARSEVSTEESTPTEKEEKSDLYGMKLAAAAVGGLAVAGAATLMLMKPAV